MACEICTYESPKNEIFVDPLDGEYYIVVDTLGDSTMRLYINYCPYCGRKLCEEEYKDSERLVES